MEFKLGGREAVFLHPVGELTVEQHELATPELEAIFILPLLQSATTTHRCLIVLSDLCVDEQIAAIAKWFPLGV